MIHGMVRNDGKDCVGQVIHININIIIYICTVFILNIGTDRQNVASDFGQHCLATYPAVFF